MAKIVKLIITVSLPDTMTDDDAGEFAMYNSSKLGGILEDMRDDDEEYSIIDTTSTIE